MTKKTYSVTLAGKPWTIRFSARLRKHYGFCHHSKKEIVISSKESPSDTLNVLIHECLHALFPNFEEAFVNAAADELHEILDVVDID